MPRETMDVALLTIKQLGKEPFNRNVWGEGIEGGFGVKICTEKGSVTLTQNWVMTVAGWSDKDIAIEIVELVKALDAFNNCPHLSIRAHSNLYYTTEVNYIQSDGSQHTIRMSFDSVKGLVEFGKGLERRVSAFLSTRDSLKMSICTFEKILEEVPSKRSTRQVSQRSGIEQTISDLRQKVDALRLMDFIEDDIRVLQ
ncbi:hypothetical protein [Vibrio crassostreae]|uniref:hypothetical protein n=1 Tax=Vibrio crassostreae TaxID=246167 RepID=UPI001B30149E|nr:hypothetical protein [Vibrio crassostreae]